MNKSEHLHAPVMPARALWIGVPLGIAAWSSLIACVVLAIRWIG